MDGHVKRIVRDKGFGFIRALDGSEWFFHRSELPQGRFDTLNEGDSVTFTGRPNPKGPRAEDVQLT